MRQGFFDDGFAIYDGHPKMAAWAKAVMPLAEEALKDDKLLQDWLRCEGTWFVGVDALNTGPEGQAGEVLLQGPVIDDVNAYCAYVQPIHKAQLSAVYPGYPKPNKGESEAAFNFRLKRDAAHVDGLHPIGKDRRRHLTEFHAFLLGIGLTECSPDASPLVVWRGSHTIIQKALSDTLNGIDPNAWQDVDLTETYHAARRMCFEHCERVELPIKSGQALVVHRHALHGIAPWDEQARAPKEGRMIAYFRPEIIGGPAAWLKAD